MGNNELLEVAEKAMQKAYAPYSGFMVGAALVADNGNVYSGCNIENASYGATLCAERTAISMAVADGNRNISKIAIVSSSEEYTFPCGICRQVMAEFMKPDSLIILSEGNNVKEFRLDELLPHSFSFEQ